MKGINESIHTAIRDMGATPRHVIINSTNIFWVEKGDGKPIVLLHGFDSCFYTWRRLFSELKGEFRIIALDLPGFGLSGDAPEKNYTLEYFSKTIQYFLDYLGIKQAFFCGHSYGGLVCQDIVARMPDRVKSIVLIASAVAGAVRPELSKMRNLMLYGYYDLIALQPIDIKVYSKVKLRTPDGLKYLQRFPECYNGNGKVERPCLIVWGCEDRIGSIEKAQIIAQQYKNVSIKTLQGAGHHPHEEKPDEFHNILLNFLNM